MELAYAQALWQTIEKGMAPKKAVAALHEHLVTRGRAALMPRIGKAFERLAERQRQKSGVTLFVAHEKDEKKAMREAKALLKKLKGEVAVKVDESLIGGWRVEGNELSIDASFKKMLLDMYNRATAEIT